MGLNLGLFLIIVTYLSTELRAGKSGSIPGPDLPREGTGEIFYDGENAGWGPVVIFLRST